MLHALPVSADVGTFTLSDRAEIRFRDPDPLTNQQVFDFEDMADARAVFGSHNATYTLAYNPRLSLLDLNTPNAQLSFLNGLLASGEWRSGHVDFLAKEAASYGSLAFESLSTLPLPGSTTTPPPAGGTTPAPTPIANAQLVPSVATVQFFSSDTALSSTLTFKPWVFTSTVGYLASGGADNIGGNACSNSTSCLPFQNGPYLHVLADDRVAPRDHMVTVVNAVETAFSPIGTDVVLIEAEEQWKHAWSKKTDSMLSGGVYVDRSRDAVNAPYVWAQGPTAEASLTQRLGAGTTQGQLGLDFRLAPVVNQLTGLVDQRIQATLIARWSKRRVSLGASGTVAESTALGTLNAAQIFMGEVDASYATSDALSFDLGARLLAQNENVLGPTVMAGQTPPVINATFNQGVVFLAATFRFVKAHF